MLLVPPFIEMQMVAIRQGHHYILAYILITLYSVLELLYYLPVHVGPELRLFLLVFQQGHFLLRHKLSKRTACYGTEANPSLLKLYRKLTLLHY